MIPNDCHLCEPIRGVIAGDDLWTMALNDNQALLGRCYFALNRHETDAMLIDPAEQESLFKWLRRAKAAIDALFAPDHYNYVMLMNVEPHVHAHIIPRYASERRFVGELFYDGHYGGHYDPGALQLLSVELFDKLASAIGDALVSEADL